MARRHWLSSGGCRGLEAEELEQWWSGGLTASTKRRREWNGG